MTVYTKRSFFGHYPDTKALNLISMFLMRSLKTLMSLVSPEDTTENEGVRPSQFTKYTGHTIFGAIKAVFWIANSIFIALLMGHLS